MGDHVNPLLFRLKWGIVPGLAHPYHSCVEAGSIVPWTAEWLDRVDEVLRGIPRGLIAAAWVHHLFVAEDLENLGLPHDGVTYCTSERKLRTAGTFVPPFDRLVRKRLLWIGLDSTLFTAPFREVDLQVSNLHARVLEELAHAWDYRLLCRRSPCSSGGSLWKRSIGLDRSGKLASFPISDRKSYTHVTDPIAEGLAEDWASAVVWFIYRPNDLRRISRPHHDFARALFSAHGIRS